MDIKVTSLQSIEEVLQESYDLTLAQIAQIQGEMNKLAHSVDLSSELVDGKVRYAKSMHDYITDKDKAIQKKIDIAKLMADIYKFNGDVRKAIDKAEKEETTLDANALRAQLSKNYKDKKSHNVC